MSMAVGGNKGGPMADINVTPMADIMIVLLIIFMVITPMLQKGVDVKLPQAGNTKDRKDDAKIVTVAITRSPYQLYFGGLKVDTPGELAAKVREKIQDLAEGNRMVYLKADQEMDYAEVTKVMDVVREVGVEEIALIAQKKVTGS